MLATYFEDSETNQGDLVHMAISYDELANDFDERYRHHSFPGIQARLRRLAISPATSKVLEVGCGTGHWLSIVNDLPIELRGVDLSRAMLERAHVRASRAQVVCASAENIPFPGGSFDVIFCVNAFHHFSDPKKFLRDSMFLLRPGGQLAIFGLDPHAPSTEWYLYDYFPDLMSIDLTRYLPVAEIKRLITEAGFSNVFAEPADHIQQTFIGEAVFQDPFLVRGSTSQLLLISQNVYSEGNALLDPQSKMQSAKSARLSSALT